MLVRQLTADDLAAYRALHRFAMTESPLGTVETPATDAARTDESVRGVLARGDGWGVFDGNRLVGKLTIDALPYDSLKHVFWLHAVYLHPDARGRGAGVALLEAALAAARANGATRAALWVNSENAPARRLYERAGFRETGRVPQGITVQGQEMDDVLMTLALD
jgi:GNAT superfamily N-acetyltransferase